MLVKGEWAGSVGRGGMGWLNSEWDSRRSSLVVDLKACGIGGHDCFQTMGVLRISLGCFIFFFIMFVTTCSTSKLHETRNIWHSRWWPLKFIMLVVSLIIPFFVHSDFIQLYGELARVGAGCFLGLFTSTVFYIAFVCGIGVMYSHYVPRPSCTLNIFFISWTAILLLVMMVISLHSKVSVCQELGFLRFVRSPPLHLGLPPLEGRDRELLTVARAKLILADFVLHKMITSSEFDGIFAIEHDAGTDLVGMLLASVAKAFFLTEVEYRFCSIIEVGSSTPLESLTLGVASVCCTIFVDENDSDFLVSYYNAELFCSLMFALGMFCYWEAA
ncbi:hypothetical protein RHGRI_019911 [Rhododendron griersonianum]|uniref:Uncharacterized protein n=1 Tax=Rhododendron griersonianum TaxID=479676 RepID=A0AAV6JJ09_9ERIC|nr:hypothetical protein RHGRI_019911 [Rhododendron griersonianum]